MKLNVIQFYSNFYFFFLLVGVLSLSLLKMSANVLATAEKSLMKHL